LRVPKRGYSMLLRLRTSGKSSDRTLAAQTKTRSCSQHMLTARTRCEGLEK
jgi:hypothetical protein